MKKTLCVFFITVSVTTYVSGQTPSANFTASPLSGCSPLIVNFQDLSTGNPVSWQWDFGNGNTSALQNPSASYFTPGNYTVKLTVTNAAGNSNTLVRSQYITVYDNPNVNFSASSQSGCFPFRVQFTDLSTPGAGNTNANWQWDFGDGTTSTLQNPFVTYTAAGNYSVTLRVTNDKGCTKIISRPNYITVTPGVTSGFTNTQPTVCSAPANINFTNTSTGPGTLTYIWNFGDGSNSALQSPSHNYTSNGTFNVTLITTSSGGCVDTAKKTVTIGGFSTSFNSPPSACLNQIVNFTNTSSPVPSNVLWNFGDGSTSTLTNPTHVYAATGTYTVRLYNTYSICNDSATRTITINSLPTANFTAPVTSKCEPPLTVNFQNTSVGGVSWQWDFGDGNTSTLQNPSHTYTSYGFYNVTLIATNANGCTDTITKPNFVRIRRAILGFPGLPTQGCIPYTRFFNLSINVLDAVTSYLWDFGDGSTSTLQTPTHTYNVQGTYTVKLFITTSTGCTDSLVLNNAVKVGSKPVVDFSAAPIPVCAYKPVQFTDLSTTIDQWQWDFGDATHANGIQNPGHTYTDTGYFTIRLIGTNNGCPDTMLKTNYIQVLPPIAKFTSTANCLNRLQFSFSDQSIGAISWLWNFGDGTTSTTQNPVHNFPALGSYNVSLTVTNGSCSHTIIRTVRPTKQSPDFSVASDTVCRGNSITLTPTNINPALTTSLIWRFGNGAQITGTTVAPASYTYPASGTYTVTLVVTDINGCMDSIVKTNYIRVNGPIANFNATNPTGCTGLTATFNDLSTTDGINALVSWQWNFGDGTVQTFTGPPFQHTYNTTGTFSVTLKVTDASGCSHSIIKSNIIVTTDPMPNFVSPDTLSCPGSTVRFTNTSVASGFSSSWNFGDGNTSTTTSPTHNYAATGLYTVKLTITDSYGCPDSIIKTNYIKVDNPVASFTVNDSISSCTPFEVQFTNTSTYYKSVFWDFGPGEGTSTVNNPVHYYSLPGIYPVKLVATSPGGCKDSAFINITVNDTTGSVITYNPLGGCNPLLVNLNTFTSGIMDSYFWDFGDGFTQSTTTPVISHTYNSFGNYVPKVIMMDPSGCLIPLTGADTIKIVGSNPNFGFSSSLLCDSGLVSFTDSTTSSEPIAIWQWDFGDGGSSTLQNPQHSYTAPGIYDVTLFTQTLSGCQNSVTIPAAIKVVLRPLIDITGITKICVFDSILHAGIFLRADTSVVTWQWTFPNGNTSTLQNPPYQVYSTAGNFTVTAISTNSSGCKDTTTENIIVSPLPTVTMPGQMTVQAGFPATIPATYSTGVNTWTWTPATGLSCTNCPTPDADPNFNTTYYLEFSDANGCRNNDSIQIIVVCKDGNLYVPNTFSPNGDGSNDRFYPRGRGLYSIKFLRIFNRWGEIVFENRDFLANDAVQGWDGKYKGKEPQPDVYVYQIEVVCDNGDIIKLSGNISLIL